VLFQRFPLYSYLRREKYRWGACFLALTQVGLPFLSRRFPVLDVIYRNETSLPPVVRRFVDIIKTVAKTIHTLR